MASRPRGGFARLRWLCISLHCRLIAAGITNSDRIIPATKRDRLLGLGALVANTIPTLTTMMKLDRSTSSPRRSAGRLLSRCRCPRCRCRHSSRLGQRRSHRGRVIERLLTHVTIKALVVRHPVGRSSTVFECTDRIIQYDGGKVVERTHQLFAIPKMDKK